MLLQAGEAWCRLMRCARRVKGSLKRPLAPGEFALPGHSVSLIHSAALLCEHLRTNLSDPRNCTNRHEILVSFRVISWVVPGFIFGLGKGRAARVETLLTLGHDLLAANSVSTL